MIIYQDMEQKHIKEALMLALDELQTESSVCGQLPMIDYINRLENIIHDLCNCKYKKVAVEDGKVIGYIAFMGPWDGIFGNVKGVFSPLGGSAFSGNNRNMLASKLFQEIGKELVSDGVYSFALSRYAHDDEVGRSFIMNGFGIRCTDAVMRLKGRAVICEPDQNLEIHELKPDEKKEIFQLRSGLVKHLCASPTFCPPDLSHFHAWFDNEDIRVFAVKNSEHYMGFMSVTSEGETFITEYDQMLNICGAYVDERYRSSGIAKQLLEHICRVLEKEGIQYLGVDCETLNPTALRFWGKYFVNYTYSYARRIDERVTGYDQYMKSMGL